jgi:1-acyl-sn-glycerol-3-phosphate acyltransferase
MVRLAAVETVGRAALHLYASPDIHGTDRLAGLRGSAVFVANHHSHADTPILLTTIPEPWRHKLVIGAGADYFFPNRVKSSLSALFIGAIPIERTAVSRTTIEQIIRLLRQGWSTVIYPEGGRSPDGWGQEFKGGAAFVAKQAGVPIVPVHIEGTGSILAKGKRWPKRAKIVINFGAPLYFTDDDNTKTSTARVQTAVEALADERHGDWWRARQRLHSGLTPGLAGPSAAPWRRNWEHTARRRRPKRIWPKL